MEKIMSPTSDWMSTPEATEFEFIVTFNSRFQRIKLKTKFYDSGGFVRLYIKPHGIITWAYPSSNYFVTNCFPADKTFEDLEDLSPFKDAGIINGVWILDIQNTRMTLLSDSDTKLDLRYADMGFDRCSEWSNESEYVKFTKDKNDKPFGYEYIIETGTQFLIVYSKG